MFIHVQSGLFFFLLATSAFYLHETWRWRNEQEYLWKFPVITKGLFHNWPNWFVNRRWILLFSDGCKEAICNKRFNLLDSRQRWFLFVFHQGPFTFTVKPGNKTIKPYMPPDYSTNTSSSSTAFSGYVKLASASPSIIWSWKEQLQSKIAITRDVSPPVSTVYNTMLGGLGEGGRCSIPVDAMHCNERKKKTRQKPTTSIQFL